MPDCLASHFPGELDPIEQVVATVENARSVEEAADILRPDMAPPNPATHADAVALFRYGLIADLLHLPVGARSLHSRLRETAPPRQARPTLDAAMAKLFASEAAHRAADKAMQILASRGYRRGSVVERLFRLGGHPKPAINRHLKTGHLRAVDRDVDRDEGLVLLRRYGKRLGHQHTATSHRLGSARVDASPH